MPAKLHSTGDWDFQYADWTLDTAYYVDSPTSLRLDASVAPKGHWTVLCRTADTQVIEQGRIVTWVRLPNNSLDHALLVFRNQSALGSPTLTNSYYIDIYNSLDRWFYRDTDNLDWLLATFGAYGAIETWAKFRVTWWNGKNLQNVDATVCRFEYWNGSAWVQVGSDAYDTNQRGKGSATNRAGIGTVSQSVASWFDLTEIWCTGS